MNKVVAGDFPPVGQEQTQLLAAQNKHMETQVSNSSAYAGQRWEGQAELKLNQLPCSKETTTTSGFKNSLGQRPDKPHFPSFAICFKNRSHTALLFAH